MPDDLVQMVRETSRARADGQITFFEGGEEAEALPYAQLWEDSGRIAAGLLDRGLQPGERVALIMPTCAESVRGFFGVLAAGGVPVPLPPPLPFSNPERYAQRIRGAIASSRMRRVLSPSSLDRFVESFARGAGDGLSHHTVGSLLEPAPAHQPISPDSPAFIQYTSGSTTAPKGVVLTHRNLLTNMRAIASGTGMGPGDVVNKWIPLFHDMGLIGSLAAIMSGADLLLMSPEDFVMDPRGWLLLFGRRKGTICPAPNMAYLHCVRRVSAESVKKLDLSTWRAALVGAEAVDPLTMRRFAEHFAPAGFRAEALMPVYGLAEATLAVTFSPPGRGVRTAWVNRAALGQGVAERVEPGHPEAREITSVGRPVADVTVQLRDGDGALLPDGRVGEVHVQGGGVMQGYDLNEEATRGALKGGRWLATGDLGFLLDGDLYLVGRRKEMIIVGGQNVYATDVEHVAGRVPGVGTQGVMALGEASEETGTEALVVLAETREKDAEKRKQLIARIRHEVSSSLGVSPSVLLVPRGTLPRTSSGKLERHRGRDLCAEARGLMPPQAPGPLAATGS